MQIVKANPEEKKEKLVKLGEVKEGEIFRFLEVSFEEALTQKDEATFFMKISSAEAPERAKVVSLDGKLVLVRDADRRVIKHDATISIHSNI